MQPYARSKGAELGRGGLIRPAADALDVLSLSVADAECAGRPLNRRPGFCSTIVGAGFCASGGLDAVGWVWAVRSQAKTAFLVAGKSSETNATDASYARMV